MSRRELEREILSYQRSLVLDLSVRIMAHACYLKATLSLADNFPLCQPHAIQSVHSAYSSPQGRSWVWDTKHPPLALRRCRGRTAHSVVFFYFFALIAEEGFLISPGYSLELCIQMGIYFLFPFAFHFSSFHSYF